MEPRHPGPSQGWQPNSQARPPRADSPQKKGGAGGVVELIVDKAIDFALIFVGLYAATALQRCQDTARHKDEYVSLLRDFKRELDANQAQEESIAKDLGPIEQTEPGKNLGPMQQTFKHFFEELDEDEKVVQCLHDQFVAVHGEEAKTSTECRELYAQFDEAHESHEKESFSFEPAVLTPFYRREVWQLYIADGVKTFRNKELAVRIAEVYANAELIEEQVEDIENAYNNAFMVQVGRTAATDMELAQIVHDEETHHAFSDADLTLFLHVDEAVKQEHYAALEVQRTLELKAERMKKTALLMRAEIEAVQVAIDEELQRQGAKPEG